ncbi:hypothetical protein HK102_011434 [Quaeritorhiza haematococci]|nr:hypothetical protein HK102_011434 [Quaeritorhiza haematococci]
MDPAIPAESPALQHPDMDRNRGITVGSFDRTSTELSLSQLSALTNDEDSQLWQQQRALEEELQVAPAVEHHNPESPTFSNAGNGPEAPATSTQTTSSPPSDHATVAKTLVHEADPPIEEEDRWTVKNKKLKRSNAGLMSMYERVSRHNQGLSRKPGLQGEHSADIAAIRTNKALLTARLVENNALIKTLNAQIGEIQSHGITTTDGSTQTAPLSSKDAEPAPAGCLELSMDQSSDTADVSATEMDFLPEEYASLAEKNEVPAQMQDCEEPPPVKLNESAQTGSVPSNHTEVEPALEDNERMMDEGMSIQRPGDERLEEGNSLVAERSDVQEVPFFIEKNQLCEPTSDPDPTMNGCAKTAPLPSRHAEVEPSCDELQSTDSQMLVDEETPSELTIDTRTSKTSTNEGSRTQALQQENALFKLQITRAEEQTEGASTNAEIAHSRLETENASLKAQITSMQNEMLLLHAMMVESDALKAEMAALRAQSSNYDRIKAENASLQAQIVEKDRLKGEIESLKANNKLLESRIVEADELTASLQAQILQHESHTKLTTDGYSQTDSLLADSIPGPPTAVLQTQCAANRRHSVPHADLSSSMEMDLVTTTVTMTSAEIVELQDEIVLLRAQISQLARKPTTDESSQTDSLPSDESSLLTNGQASRHVAIAASTSSDGAKENQEANETVATRFLVRMDEENRGHLSMQPMPLAHDSADEAHQKEELMEMKRATSDQCISDREVPPPHEKTEEANAPKIFSISPPNKSPPIRRPNTRQQVAAKATSASLLAINAKDKASKDAASTTVSRAGPSTRMGGTKVSINSNNNSRRARNPTPATNEVQDVEKQVLSSSAPKSPAEILSSASSANDSNDGKSITDRSSNNIDCSSTNRRVTRKKRVDKDSASSASSKSISTDTSVVVAPNARSTRRGNISNGSKITVSNQGKGKGSIITSTNASPPSTTPMSTTSTNTSAVTSNRATAIAEQVAPKVATRKTRTTSTTQANGSPRKTSTTATKHRTQVHQASNIVADSVASSLTDSVAEGSLLNRNTAVVKRKRAPTKSKTEELAGSSSVNTTTTTTTKRHRALTKIKSESSAPALSELSGSSSVNTTTTTKRKRAPAGQAAPSVAAPPPSLESELMEQPAAQPLPTSRRSKRLRLEPPVKEENFDAAAAPPSPPSQTTTKQVRSSSRLTGKGLTKDLAGKMKVRTDGSEPALVRKCRRTG